MSHNGVLGGLKVCLFLKFTFFSLMNGRVRVIIILMTIYLINDLNLNSRLDLGVGFEMY